MYRRNCRFLALLAVVAACSLMSMRAASGANANASHEASSTKRKLKLVWGDEFNGPDGSLPNPAKWSIVTGGAGFGNNELEYYTARKANIHQDAGNLVITARKETYAGADGVRKYTSARIETKGHFEQAYGRIEARIKIPKGQGIWPAFWAIGNNFDAVGWPECGEMDIMENVGYEPSMVHGTLHGPGYSGGDPLTGAFMLPEGARASDDFHIYAAEWEPKEIRFYIDDVLYETQTSAGIPSKGHWVFDHPFFILLNVAVGGNWPGSPDASTVFPTSMLVDYVRVYQWEDAIKGAAQH